MQNAFGSALQSGNSIVADIDSGYLQKMLVTPVSRPAILLGRLASDAFRVVVQTAIILGLGYALGVAENKPFYVTTGVVGILLIFFTLAFFGLAWSGISLALGMKTRSSETVFAIGGVITFPLLFLSPALFPLSFLPAWVQTVSMFNPVSYCVTATRALDDQRLPMEHHTSSLGCNRLSRGHHHERYTVPVQKSSQLNRSRVNMGVNVSWGWQPLYFHFNHFRSHIQPFQRFRKSSHDVADGFLHEIVQRQLFSVNDHFQSQIFFIIPCFCSKN